MKSASATRATRFGSMTVCWNHQAAKVRLPTSSPTPSTREAKARRTEDIFATGGRQADAGTGLASLAVASQPAPAGFLRMGWRGLRRRCPRCGGARWFSGWFAKVDRCQTCGYKYERSPGFVLGEVTVNTIMTFGLLAVVIAVGIVVTYPDIPLVPLLVAAVVAAVAVPILGYPFSSTLWAAVDLSMHPLEPEEVADAAAHAGQGPATGF